MIKLTMAAAVALAATSTVAGAQTTADDARCLLVSSFYARSVPDQAAQRAAQTVAAFYLGRVDGRVSPAALKAALAAGQKTLTRQLAAKTMNDCEARMAAADQKVQALSPPPAASAKPAQGR